MRTRGEVRTEKKADETTKEAEPGLDRSNPEPEKSKEKVDEISGHLRDELKPPELPFKFKTAHGATTSELRADLAAVVEKVYVNDIQAEWEALQKALEIGEKRSEHAHAVAHLDKAERRAERAYRLYLTARAASESWEAENEVIFGAMWSEATRSLQKEKDDGIRSKQITDADVKARVATLFPDEYRSQEDRRRKIAFTVKSLERLADVWLGRARSLQGLVGKLR